MGGKWNASDLPVIPGFYMNFIAAAKKALTMATRGTVIVPVRASWGPVRQFVEIKNSTDLETTFGTDTANNATAYTIIDLILKGKPAKVLAYRIAAAAAAKARITLKDTVAANVMDVVAYYEGARGNTFKITVQNNLADATKKDLLLYEGTKLLRTFTAAGNSIQAMVDAINNDLGQQFIKATFTAAGNNTLAAIASQALTTGDSGIAGVVNADYTNALAVFETQDFHVLTLDNQTDPALQQTVEDWIKRLRAEGKGVEAVMGGSAADDTAADAVNKATTRSNGFDNEGIVNVGTGAKIGVTSYCSAHVAAWAAGAIAGSKFGGSVTFLEAPFDDVTRRWTAAEQKLAIQNGVFLLIHDGRKVKVLSAVNTLKTLQDGQNESWKAIQIIRSMDQINDDLKVETEDHWIGKVGDNDEGRLALMGAYKAYLAIYETAGVIDSGTYDAYLHPDYYGPGSTKQPAPGDVYPMWEAKFTRAMEKVLGTFVAK